MLSRGVQGKISGPLPSSHPRRRALRLVAALLPALGLLLLVAAALPAGHAAGTHCVDPAGAGGCFTTIQAAVDAAAAGDLVLIAPGVYTESVAVAKPLSLRGGWEPAGSLTQTIIHSPGGCALDLTGVAGTIGDLTLVGGAPAVVCGIVVADLTLERLDISGGLDGISLLVAGPVTQTALLVHDNAQDGLSYLCLGGAGEVVHNSGSHFADNGRYAVSGGESCDSVFADVVVENNAAAGFFGFGGQCPIGREVLFDSQLLLSGATVTGSAVGIHKLCGGVLRVEQSWVGDHLTGTLVEGEVIFHSENSLYVNNERAAWFLKGGTTAVSHNDTFADNSELTLALWPDEINCFLAPAVTIGNGIFWATTTPIGAPADRPCPGNAAYHVALAHTLLVSAALYAADPDVDLGKGILDEDPRFVDAAYRVGPDSPAVDSGSAPYPTQDRDGTARPQDGDLDGLAVVDRGAYELPFAGFRYYFPVVVPPSAQQ